MCLDTGNALQAYKTHTKGWKDLMSRINRKVFSKEGAGKPSKRAETAQLAATSRSTGDNSDSNNNSNA